MNNSLNQIHEHLHICERCNFDAFSCECDSNYLIDGSFQPSLDAKTDNRCKPVAIICDGYGRKRLQFMDLKEGMAELAHMPLNWSLLNLDTGMRWTNERNAVIKKIS